MYKLSYTLIKQRLIERVPDLVDVDIHLGQLGSPEIMKHIRSTPKAFVELNPIDTNNRSNKVQDGILTFIIHLVTSTNKQDDKRILEDMTEDHFSIMDAIFGSLQGYSATINDIDGVELEDNKQVFNSISRSRVELVKNMSKIMISRQYFRCQVYDNTAYIYEKTAKPVFGLSGNIIGQVT
jgi:CheY-like chemotaxis protein